MARTARNVNPTLSSDPRNKLLAALNWFYGKLKHGDPYDRAPMYFDACLEWHERLSPDQQETCRTLPDVLGSAHEHTAESMAASLPPAPRCPLWFTNDLHLFLNPFFVL
jgi:hypothetical protein